MEPLYCPNVWSLDGVRHWGTSWLLSDCIMWFLCGQEELWHSPCQWCQCLSLYCSLFTHLYRTLSSTDSLWDPAGSYKIRMPLKSLLLFLIQQNICLLKCHWQKAEHRGKIIHILEIQWSIQMFNKNEIYKRLNVWHVSTSITFGVLRQCALRIKVIYLLYGDGHYGNEILLLQFLLTALGLLFQLYYCLVDVVVYVYNAEMFSWCIWHSVASRCWRCQISGTQRWNCWVVKQWWTRNPLGQCLPVSNKTHFHCPVFGQSRTKSVIQNWMSTIVERRVYVYLVNWLFNVTFSSLTSHC